MPTIYDIARGAQFKDPAGAYFEGQAIRDQRRAQEEEEQRRKAQLVMQFQQLQMAQREQNHRMAEATRARNEAEAVRLADTQAKAYDFWTESAYSSLNEYNRVKDETGNEEQAMTAAQSIHDHSLQYFEQTFGQLPGIRGKMNLEALQTFNPSWAESAILRDQKGTRPEMLGAQEAEVYRYANGQVAGMAVPGTDAAQAFMDAGASLGDKVGRPDAETLNAPTTRKYNRSGYEIVEQWNAQTERWEVLARNDLANSNRALSSIDATIIRPILQKMVDNNLNVEDLEVGERAVLDYHNKLDAFDVLLRGVASGTAGSSVGLSDEEREELSAARTALSRFPDQREQIEQGLRDSGYENLISRL